MTVSEMINGVKMGLDLASNLTAPVWFTNEEILYWLNEAQLTLVKQKLFGNNFRKEDFEASPKRIDDLLPLVTESANLTILDTPADYPNSYYYALDPLKSASSERYMFFIQGRIYDSVNAKWLITQTITLDKVKNFIETDYNKPYIENPVLFLKDDRIYIIFDPEDTNTAGYKLIIEYIKEPKELVASGASGYQVTTSELPEEVHNEIVALAVNMMLETVSPERIQTNTLQLSKKE